jgi:hypothetical protein
VTGYQQGDRVYEVCYSTDGKTTTNYYRLEELDSIVIPPKHGTSKIWLELAKQIRTPIQSPFPIQQYYDAEWQLQRQTLEFAADSGNDSSNDGPTFKVELDRYLPELPPAMMSSRQSGIPEFRSSDRRSSPQATPEQSSARTAGLGDQLETGDSRATFRVYPISLTEEQQRDLISTLQSILG